MKDFFQEDSSNNVLHSNIESTYSKNMSYSNGTNGYNNHNGRDHIEANGYSDKYRPTDYQSGTEHTEIANDSSPSSSEHVNREAELGML